MRNVHDERMKMVHSALDRYSADVNDISAGYALLRYVKKGWISIEKPETFTEDVLQWYPKNIDYVFLRHADNLYYNGNVS